MAVIFDDQTRQWFMALMLRGESFSMPLGDPLPMEREGGCSEDQLGLDLPQPETSAKGKAERACCGEVSLLTISFAKPLAAIPGSAPTRR